MTATQGLMQQTPLLVSSILRYAAAAHPRREVISRQIEGPIWRYDYAALEARAARAAHALERLGVKRGERVSSLAWNTHRHLELFYAATGMGAVLHTANPRLFADQLVYTINHAGSGILLFETNLAPIVAAIAEKLERVTTFVVLADREATSSCPVPALSYETLLSDEPAGFSWPELEENAGAFLCYTSGTTGDPKGVLYSHRAVVLHAMGAGLASAFGFTPFDVVMPCASLYHATAWGLPFVAPLCGAKFVLPGDKMDPASLNELIAAEGVTFTCGVPTIWTGYLAWLEARGLSPTSLKTVMIGGSAVPLAMAEAFRARHGVDVLQIWGMTETCPLGVVASPTPALAAHGEAEMRQALWTRSGRLQFGIEIKIVGEDGKDAPWDGETSGALVCRGPWTVRRYFRQNKDVVDAQGWFDTGDIATIDRDGFLRITDRAKDVIKSGGEWISSIDLENIACGCEGVRMAAVIGVPHPKWEERPVMIIEASEADAVSPEKVIAYLAPRIANWWMPDEIVLAPIPLTATGKIDKKKLREAWRERSLVPA